MKWVNIRVFFLLLELPVILLYSTFSHGQSLTSRSDEQVLQVHTSFLDEAIYLTKHCVGFSPPVSGRAFAYLTLGMYESSVDFLPEMRSLSGQLNGYERTHYAGKKKYDRAIVALACDIELIKYLYRNRPPRNDKEIVALHDSLAIVLYEGVSKKLIDRSINLGKSIANEIIAWSKMDGGDNGFNENFPEDFDPPECQSCWTRTTPGYITSLLPYWGSVRWMLPNSQDTYKDFEGPNFSIDSNSILFQDAMNLFENSKETDRKFEDIAEYWDDAPGYSGTPSGHFFSLARCLSQERNLDLKTSLQFYAKLGVAMNEAYIAAWKLKYTYNFIRPITYIQRYIHPHFNTRISTPPFPEFPSGHSYQSASAGEVIKAFFGDSISFTDSTNLYRDDINGTPRTFHSVTELVEEVSISRFYAGIHFRSTLEQSMLMGQVLGRYVVKQMNCLK